MLTQSIATNTWLWPHR